MKWIGLFWLAIFVGKAAAQEPSPQASLTAPAKGALNTPEQAATPISASEPSALEWFKNGVLSSQSGDFQVALQHFEKARALAPNWALPYLEIAVAHQLIDNNRKVIGECLEKSAKLGPDIPRARFLFGVYLQEEGRRAEAIAELVQALRVRPSLLDARYRLASMFIEEGKQIEGIEQYEEVLKQQPTHIGAHRNLAVIFEQSGQLEQAEQHLLAIAGLAPENSWHLNTLGRFYDRVGWKDKARETFRKAQRLEPAGDKRKLRPLLMSPKPKAEPDQG